MAVRRSHWRHNRTRSGGVRPTRVRLTVRRKR
jgi:hypothetical protein